MRGASPVFYDRIRFPSAMADSTYPDLRAFLDQLGRDGDLAVVEPCAGYNCESLDELIPRDVRSRASRRSPSGTTLLGQTLSCHGHRLNIPFVPRIKTVA